MLDISGIRAYETAPDESENIDIPECERMADTFIDQDLYFDTAWMYHSKESEPATKSFSAET